MVIFAILLAFIGLFNLFVPRVAWFAAIGWKIRNAEPSEAYLIIHRIGGGLACIIAIVIIAGTWQKGTQTTEKMIRDMLTSNQIESMTLQMQPITSLNTVELKNWILNSKWETPTVDYRQNSSFSSIAELDLHFANGNEIAIFDMGNGQFGVSKNLFYPDFIFSNPSLESWFSAHGY